MNEAEALSKMVAPRDPRRHIWNTGIVQVFITRACTLGCKNCSQMSQLRGSPNLMTPDQAGIVFDSLRNAPFVVGIFGGDPPSSKYFEEICEVMREKIPFERRGLWANDLLGKGDICRRTFNVRVSNLNTHCVESATREFLESWPESAPYLKGVDQDSRHGPAYVAAQDLDVLPTPAYDGTTMENTEENRWELISRCDINRSWSSQACVVNGRLRGFFCEIAAAMSMKHAASSPDWDYGVEITSDGEWWNQGMDAFAHQARKACHACGIPLKGFGQLAIGGDREQVSKTHADGYIPKDPNCKVEIVSRLSQLGERHLPRSTDYIQNGSLPIIQ